ncbi:hypothetical protein KR222_004070, partial [Zaprionus bogoriensis]
LRNSHVIKIILDFSVNAETNSGPGYLLYTRRNRNTPQRIDPEVESLLRSSFFALEPIVLSIPHWQINSSRAEQETLVPALLEREACNVFAVDLAEARSESEIVSSVRDLVLLLHKNFDVPLARQQLVAFADGSHLAGTVAQQVQQLAGEQLGQITALDPSGSEEAAIEHRLSAQDARFVQVIHTNGLGLGTLEQLGDVDYYPNGGGVQPGCESTANANACAHERALDLAAEMWSPENDFVSARCSSVEQMSAESCRWSALRMGDTGTGIYFLETRSAEPYGKGAYHISFL